MPTDPAPATFVVAAVVVRDHDGRVLTVRKRGTTSPMLPGGKIEPGETPAQAAVRETREEVGLDVRVETLGRWVCAAANEPGHLIDASVFTVAEPVDSDAAVAAAEIDELAWLDPVEPYAAGLAPLLTEHVLPALAGHAAGVCVVGIGADGWAGLSEGGRRRVAEAEVLVGSARQLDLVPADANPDAERRAWPTPLTYDLLQELAGRRVAVLASGDPLVSGIASPLREVVAPDRLEVLPALSSVALARARMRWAAEETTVLRDHAELPRHLVPGGRVLVLSAYAATAAEVADSLVAQGYAATTMTALGDLGSADETRAETRVEGLAGHWARVRPDVSALHVLALDLRGPTVPAGSHAPGLPDDAYEHDGQLTKRDLRASALARLAPRPGQLLWDIGAGAGSVGIEWLRSHPTARAVAVESDPGRAARVGRNAARLGVPGLTVVTGTAPDALADLPDPDAVFVGGGATALGLIETCRTRLRPGGRLVVHGVTLETEQVLAAAYAEHGGELTRHAVEHAAPIGTFTGWTPARAVTQWSWEAP